MPSPESTSDAQSLSPSQMQRLAQAQSPMAAPPRAAALPEAVPAPIAAPPSAASQPATAASENAAAAATVKDSAAAAAALAAAGPPAPAGSPPAAPAPPRYPSQSRYTAIRIANVSGQVRVVPRADVGDLGGLIDRAAAQAPGSDPLRELPQWRVVLEGKGEMLAVLEVGRSQLRWTEGAGAPVTSSPPPAVLEALHAALREAVKAPPPRRPRK